MGVAQWAVILDRPFAQCNFAWVAGSLAGALVIGQV